METYSGKGVSGGVAIGRICVYRKGRRQVKRVRITDADAEVSRYEAAREETVRQLGALYDKACREVGEAGAAIFEGHQMILDDEDYNRSVASIIRSQEVNAEYAVAATGDHFARMFAAMDDAYMRERAADVWDVSERLLQALGGEWDGRLSLHEPVILVAEELAPSETVQLPREKVLSIVTIRGSANSHTAILARTMAIPALVETELDPDAVDGKTGIVDGTEGLFYVEPDEETISALRERQRKEQERRELLQRLKGKESVTLDGQRLKLYANIGNVRDLAAVIQNDAEGVGLFRSEFLYLESDRYPTEEEQFRVYRQVAETLAGRRVVIRTLDIGADKQCGYFEMEHEENPALGCRAIRICLSRPELFQTQLRALFRASAFGKLAILYPMITSVWEMQRIRETVALVKEELGAQGIAFGEPEQGIMIETPAAALISDELAREADFFSIGTNDLTQYALAVDRQNPKLDRFYDAHHPAVLRMISMVVENAHRAGIRAGICGELGADLSLTREFLAMGVDELSVPPGSILPIRKLVRETNVEAYRAGR